MKMNDSRALASNDPVSPSNHPANYREGTFPRIANPADDSCNLTTTIVYQSTEMDEIVSQSIRFARSAAPILLTGESGTGKEVLSRLIHRHSRRQDRPFVAINCAAIPESLVESELFGHRRGAFTGAFNDHQGHFQRAHEGTLLLDEISEIPLSVQAKLLRVLEEQEVQKIGSIDREKIDVRIIATSNRDLNEAIREGTFRLDLFHRLSVLEIAIPPLRERQLDIECLANRFCEIYRHENETPIRGFSSEAVFRLRKHNWPGNVRELRNVVRRACILSDQTLIPGSLIPDRQVADKSMNSNTNLYGIELREVERILILNGLEKHQGDKQRVADELGITKRTLNNKLRYYRDNGVDQLG